MHWCLLGPICIEYMLQKRMSWPHASSVIVFHSILDWSIYSINSFLQIIGLYACRRCLNSWCRSHFIIWRALLGPLAGDFTDHAKLRPDKFLWKQILPEVSNLPENHFQTASWSGPYCLWCKTAFCCDWWTRSGIRLVFCNTTCWEGMWRGRFEVLSHIPSATWNWNGEASPTPEKVIHNSRSLKMEK